MTKPDRSSAQSLIASLGGTTATARLIGAPVETVHYWNKKNSIPSWRWPQIEEALRTRDDFEDQNRGRAGEA